MSKINIVVIGGGPAGYVAALRASQLGAGVTLVEENKVGGVCLNCGCIPTKFMLHGAELYHSMGNASRYGIEADNIKINLRKLQSGKNDVIARLVSGVEGLLAAGKANIISGRANLSPSNRVEITTSSGEKQSIQADRIIIATGARAAGLPVPGADAPDILDYKSLLELESIPESMVIIGGGVIGVEMATLLNRLGCKVSIVEMMPRIIPSCDAETVSVVHNALRKDRVDIFCGARVEKIEDSGNKKRVTFSDGTEIKTLEAEKVAVTAGMKPNIERLGLEECGIVADGGGIKVDELMQTSVSGIYAAGDVTGGMMLAHIGYAEGKMAAENAMGENSVMDYQVVPQCIFTSPEIAGVGLTEEEAARDYQITVGRFPFMASGMATLLGDNRGIIKIITENNYNRILGVHIAGPSASNLIAEAALAIKMELTPGEIIETIHSHPSLSEAFWEAALDVTGETLHIPSS
ncbi:dihydrolipoyl dehydrogenase [Chloroflexota bacterium]